MKALRYTVFLILLLALLLLVAVPYAMGWWIEGQYKAWVDQANEQNPAIELSVSDYHRGWFHSTATLMVDVQDPMLRQQLSADKQADLLPIDVKVDIDHGLLVITQTPDGKKQWYVAKAVVKANIQRQQMNIASLSSLDLKNRVITQAVIHQLSIPLQGGQYLMKDASLHSQFSLNDSTGHSEINIPEITLQFGPSNKVMTLTLHDLSMQNHFYKQQSIVFGQRALTIKALDWKQGKVFATVGQMRFETAIVPEGDRTHVTMHWSMQSFNDNGEKSGPLQLDFALQSLDTEALSHLMDQLNEVQGGAALTHSSQMLFPLVGVLVRGVDGHLSLSYHSPYGLVSVKGIIKMPSSKQSNIFAVVQALKGQLDVSLPDMWLQHTLAWVVNRTNMDQHQPVVGRTSPAVQAKQAVQQLIDKKMLIQKEHQLTLQATLKSGQVLVNGQAPNFTALTAPASPDSSSPQQKTPISEGSASDQVSSEAASS